MRLTTFIRCTALETDIRKRGGRGDTIIRRRSRDKVRRAAQSSQATKICHGSITAEAIERTDIDQRKRRLDSESAEKKRDNYPARCYANNIAYTNSV